MFVVLLKTQWIIHTVEEKVEHLLAVLVRLLLGVNQLLD
jgi:hypothetical protein